MTKKKRIIISLTDEALNYLLSYVNWLETVTNHNFTKSEAIENIIMTYDFPMSSR